MENQTQNQTIIHIKKEKSVALALILSFLFGPLGMLYATVPGAIIMFIINVIVFLFTAGLGLLITFPIGMIWSYIAVKKYNEQLGNNVK